MNQVCQLHGKMHIEQSTLKPQMHLSVCHSSLVLFTSYQCEREVQTNNKPQVTADYHINGPYQVFILHRENGLSYLRFGSNRRLQITITNGACNLSKKFLIISLYIISNTRSMDREDSWEPSRQHFRSTWTLDLVPFHTTS